jgi:hypothetical protein
VRNNELIESAFAAAMDGRELPEEFLILETYADCGEPGSCWRYAEIRRAVDERLRAAGVDPSEVFAGAGLEHALVVRGVIEAPSVQNQRRNAVKIYRCNFYCPAMGNTISWHSSRKSAEAELRSLQLQRAEPPVGPEGIGCVDFPTRKKHVIQWLNSNLKSDNG